MKKVVNISMGIIILILSIIVVNQHIEIKKQKDFRDLWAKCYWQTEEQKMLVEQELWDLKSITNRIE